MKLILEFLGTVFLCLLTLFSFKYIFKNIGK
ncbi:hypothetical protein A5816_003040 [Enterococcus sp. 3G1_DIV0629]|nr:hypothetical protein A5816_003040 [Enterococcus sp. 3G1_DIV0629]